jgi:hypothetical protein
LWVMDGRGKWNGSGESMGEGREGGLSDS